MILNVFLKRKILGDISVEYLDSISGKNLRGLLGKYLGSISRKNLRGGHWRNICRIFWEGFWREYRPLYFIYWYQLANKHFETKFKIHFEFRASLRKIQDLKFWDATSSRSAPCRAVGRRRHATASWPLVRLWSLGVAQQLPGCRQRPRSYPWRSPGCLRSCMLLCSMHSSSARHCAVGNLWRGRSIFSSTRKSTEVSARCSMICTIIVGDHN